jgi:hypothetical protein
MISRIVPSIFSTERGSCSGEPTFSDSSKFQGHQSVHATARPFLRIDAPDIDIRRAVKTTAWVRSGARVPADGTPATGEQHC